MTTGAGVALARYAGSSLSPGAARLKACPRLGVWRCFQEKLVAPLALQVLQELSTLPPALGSSDTASNQQLSESI